MHTYIYFSPSFFSQAPCLLFTHLYLNKFNKFQRDELRTKIELPPKDLHFSAMQSTRERKKHSTMHYANLGGESESCFAERRK